MICSSGWISGMLMSSRWLIAERSSYSDCPYFEKDPKNLKFQAVTSSSTSGQQHQDLSKQYK